MKRMLALLICLLLCAAALPLSAETADFPSFGELTGLNAFLDAVTDENPPVSLYYTAGYGFSTAEFATADPQEISRILAALKQVEISGISHMDVTDWYPFLYIALSDGTGLGLRFDGPWLSVGTVNYELAGDDALWSALKSVMADRQEAWHTLTVCGIPFRLGEVCAADFAAFGFEVELHTEDHSASVRVPGLQGEIVIKAEQGDLENAPITEFDLQFADGIPYDYCGIPFEASWEAMEQTFMGLTFERETEEAAWLTASLILLQDAPITVSTRGSGLVITIAD